jgi:ribosome biogenesis GTPase
MTDRYFHEEEHFHARDRKQFKKERRHAQETDRSKFKKSDLDQVKNEVAILLDDPNLRSGRVIAITGEGVWVDVDHVQLLCTLKGLMKKEKMRSKNIIAVGDIVRVSPIDSSEGSIVLVEDRYSTLSRLDVSGKKEQLIAVNIDQVLIVSSLISPPLKPALIDRYLIAAELGNIHPVIVINKIDHLDETSLEEKALYQEFLVAYEQLGYPILSISTKIGTGLDNLRAIMKNKASVFAGQSGVGKSSLLNAAFGFSLKVGELTQKTFKGSHMTTSAELLPLPDGGFCIDTPGVRSFGVWNLQREHIMNHFREFHSLASQCRYPDCTHLNEPSCAVQEGVKSNTVSAIRYESYKSLMDEILAGIDNRTKRKLDL